MLDYGKWEDWLYVSSSRPPGETWRTESDSVHANAPTHVGAFRVPEKGISG